jgi:cytochrome c oxidase cbb3-type subunit 3
MFEHLNLSTDTVNQLSLLAAALIILITVFVVAKYIKQIKDDKSSGELAEENWDGIGEYKNPLPIGWALSMLALMIWAVWYWLLSPYAVNAYSQIGEYNEEVKAHKATFEKKWANATPETLQEMGEGIFLVNCAPCHGITGDGINGKSQGFDTRMTEAQILDVIKNGQNQLKYPMGAMPGGMATGDDAVAIAKWLASGGEGEKPASFAACASCHGDDGRGNNGMSPNIIAYDEAVVSHTLANGKKGIIGMMPSFKGILNDVQTKAVATYIMSLGNK